MRNHYDTEFHEVLEVITLISHAQLLCMKLTVHTLLVLYSMIVYINASTSSFSVKTATSHTTPPTVTLISSRRTESRFMA